MRRPARGARTRCRRPAQAARLVALRLCLRHPGAGLFLFGAGGGERGGAGTRLRLLLVDLLRADRAGADQGRDAPQLGLGLGVQRFLLLHLRPRPAQRRLRLAQLRVQSIRFQRRQRLAGAHPIAFLDQHRRDALVLQRRADGDLVPANQGSAHRDADRDRARGPRRW